MAADRRTCYQHSVNGYAQRVLPTPVLLTYLDLRTRQALQARPMRRRLWPEGADSEFRSAPSCAEEADMCGAVGLRGRQARQVMGKARKKEPVFCSWWTGAQITRDVAGRRLPRPVPIDRCMTNACMYQRLLSQNER